MIRWLSDEAPHEIGGDGSLTLHAPARTDWFIDPRTGERTSSAPVAVVVEGATPVTVSCTVEVTAAATFDAGCLFAFEDDEHWVKLAAERDPTGLLRVVSVVTNGRSDDCNHALIPAPACGLRISVDEASVALHARLDEAGWELVRYGASPFRSAPAIGLETQSPLGAGAVARFTDLRIQPTAVHSLRDGS